MPMLASYDEVANLESSELRFREACQFYKVFMGHHGPGLDPRATRFLWMCYADAFLMSLVSLRDVVTEAQELALKGSDLFRMVTVLRNVTIHRAVVSARSPLLMINREINIGSAVGRFEDPVLNGERVAEALDHYEQELRHECMWRQERRNIEGARRWNDELKAKDPPRVHLSAVFRNALAFVAGTCGWAIPAAL